MLLDEQGSQGHAEVLVGLGEAQPAKLQLLLGAVYLPRKLVDGAAEGGGQVLTQRCHDAPQHVVMENPKTGSRAPIILCYEFAFASAVRPGALRMLESRQQKKLQARHKKTVRSRIFSCILYCMLLL